MVYLRRCNLEDCDILYEWSNDKIVRRNAFNTAHIPYSDHVNWFTKSLESSKRIIFIGMIDAIPVGMIRIDIENSEAVISYLIDKKHRGRGIGTHMLKLLQKTIEEYIGIDRLIGLVKKDNIASCKIFEKLGYDKFEDVDFNKYILNL